MSRFKPITSADNARYKQLKKLASSARERRKSGQTLLDGVHLIQALADQDQTPDVLIVREGMEGTAEIAQCLALFARTTALLLSPALFDVLSPVETPAGILALWTINPAPDAEHTCAVLLENIQDPGNLGGILRTAAASGVGAVYLSKGCAEGWSPKALRAGMGAHFAIAIYEQQDLALAAKQFDTVVATRLDGKHSLFEVDLTGPTAFIFGNEGAGLSPQLAAESTHGVRIPMPGTIESLNVAAATAVCLFERVRQIQSTAKH